MRHCKREDFEKFNHEDEFDRLNKNDPDKKSAICYDNPEDFILQNQRTDEEHKWFGLVVRSCAPSKYEPTKICKKPEEIEDFLNIHKLVS